MLGDFSGLRELRGLLDKIVENLEEQEHRHPEIGSWRPAVDDLYGVVDQLEEMPMELDESDELAPRLETDKEIHERRQFEDSLLVRAGADCDVFVNFPRYLLVAEVRE